MTAFPLRQRPVVSPAMPRCGKRLLFAWSLSPIVFLLLGFAFFSAGGGLSIIFSILTLVVVALYGGWTLKFAWRFYLKKEVKRRIIFRLYTLTAIFAPTAYFIGKQTQPYRIDQTMGSRSIFNEAWDTVGQQAYGYPSPFLRFLDTPFDPYGSKIMDWMSLFLNVWILLLVIFILVGAAAVLLEIITRRTTSDDQ